jgi:hypothetical protein
VNIRRLGRGDEGVVRELAEREPQAELLSDERTLRLVGLRVVGGIAVCGLGVRNGRLV